MLRQRVVTALIMAGTFLAALALLSTPALALLFGAIMGLGAWEWSRLAGWRTPFARLVYVVMVGAVLAGLYVYCDLGGEPARAQVQPFLGVACLWWSFALLWVKSYPGSAVIWRNRPMRSLMGVMMLAPAWLAAVYLLSFSPRGLLLVIMVLVVAAADIGAYFAGTAFGRHKMAPAVSPKKTWEGFWGGVAACVLLAVVLRLLAPEQYADIGILSLAAVAIAAAMASVVGDFTVSMVKRESGVKDSGNLLPGHGGVLDRLDSLCGAAPVFGLGLLLAGW
mgnify:CR=1 FL=1